jgi:hypothetical protein
VSAGHVVHGRWTCVVRAPMDAGDGVGVAAVATARERAVGSAGRVVRQRVGRGRGPVADPDVHGSASPGRSGAGAVEALMRSMLDSTEVALERVRAVSMRWQQRSDPLPQPVRHEVLDHPPPPQQVDLIPAGGTHELISRRSLRPPLGEPAVVFPSGPIRARMRFRARCPARPRCGRASLLLVPLTARTWWRLPIRQP